MIGSSKSVWGFDPRSVPGCQLWLDGADSNTVTGTTSVTAWADKSGMNYTMTNNQGTCSVSAASLNGLNTIYVPSGANLKLANFLFHTKFTTFIVGKADTGKLLIGGRFGTNNILFYEYTGNDGLLAVPLPSGTTYLDVYDTVGLGTRVVSNNTWFIWCIGYDNLTNSTANPYRINGIARTTSAVSGSSIIPSSSGTGSLYLNSVNGTGSYDSDYFAEIIHYNTTLTTAQCQTIEGYLAHKWGLTGYYDSSIPLSIPGCALWLDAADASTITGTTSVTAWRDKSGNARHLGVGSGTTAYSSNAIVLNSSYMFVNTPVNLTNVTVFIVTKSTGGNNQTVFTARPNSGWSWNSLDGFGFYIDAAVPRIRFYGDSTNTSQFNVNTSTTRLFSFQSSGTSINSWLEGTSQSGGSLASTRTSTAQGFAIGAEWNRDQNEYINVSATSSIYEAIVFNTALTTSQRQTIEGYLAKKWGFTSMYSALPSTHPFSSIRPHLRTFQPSDVPGCQLWLDAADSSSLVLSGSSVTTWNDKSGNGYHMNTLPASADWSGTAAYPTIGTSINGLQTVKFLAQSGLKQSTTLDGVKNLFWVGRIAAPDGTAAGGNSCYFLLGHDNLFDWHSAIYRGGFVDGVAQGGISYAIANLFTSDPTAVTNTTFLNVIMPSPPSISLLSVTGITGTTRYQGICYDRSTHTGWCGDLAEVIIFSTALTSSQRQQVEGYLAHKWGLSLYLPVISPLSIPGCQLWFDAADSSTITFSSGSNVSVWTNKGIVSTTATPTRGASANQITYVTVGGYPGVYINNNGSVGYNASTYSQLTIQSNFQNTADYSIFAVVNLSNVASGELQTIYGNARGASGETRTPNFGAGATLEFNFDGTNRMISSSFIGSGRLQTALVSSSSALTAYTNATAYASNTNGFTRVSTDVGPLPIIGGAFGSGNDARFATGYFHEILFYNSALTTSQRQQVEGYLARKWGISISATLPSPHSFKSFPPASIPSLPAAIESVTLTSLSTSGGTINWTSTNATGYRWYVGTGAGSGQVASGIITSGSILTTTVTYTFVSGTLYYAWVIPYNLDGLGPTTISPSTSIDAVSATGGTIVSSGGFTYHVFTSSGSLVVTGVTSMNYLVVGGGGGGGDRHGGGGGGGGVLSGTWSTSTTTYTVTVGVGGIHGATSEAGQIPYGSPNGAGSKGGDSALSGTGISITAYGGGGGGTYDGNPTGTVGSGGGGGGQNLSGVAGTAGQGNAGGAGLLPGAGGGGGAGGAGVAANTGTGGIGTSSFSTHLLAAGYGTTFAVPTSPNIVISGGVAYIAGGGGGCAGTSPGPGGSGGLGGGGRGDWTDSFISAGTPNTGGGGGGTRSDLGLLYSIGRDGGSGLVLVWY